MPPLQYLYTFQKHSYKHQFVELQTKADQHFFKKTGLWHRIVNCQLSIVNSAKPLKHRFSCPFFTIHKEGCL